MRIVCPANDPHASPTTPPRSTTPLPGRSIELNIVVRAGAAIQVMAGAANQKPGSSGVEGPVLGSVDSWLRK